MSKYNGVKTLEVLEGADNYNEWIISKLAPHIESPALEIGAGTGNISFFFKHLDELVLSDIDRNLVDILKKRFQKNKKIKTRIIDISGKFRKVNSKFKTIYSVNVLEHINDDLGALRNMNLLLERKGKIIILVPAKKWAYTHLDKNLGHIRRYEKSELIAILEQANFEIESIEYFNIIGLLSWVVRNIVSRNHNQLKSSHVKIFDTIVPFLRKIEPKNNLPVGISLIVVARKK